MSAYLSPIGNEQEADSNGAPVSGALINTYVAGTTTPVTTYTDAAGLVPQANPIVCNSAGYPASPIFLPAGVAVKMVFTTSVASGSVAYRPPVDNIQGVNDPSFATTVSEWTAFSGTPSFISATSFSVAGDQTNTFQILRRLRSTNTGGTIYSRISNSAFAAGITTVTVVNASGTLDAGLSAVSYGLLSATNPSIPETTVGQNIRTAATVAAAQAALASTGTILQELTFTDAGSSTAANTLTNVTSGAKLITPKSSSSTFIIECMFQARVTAGGAGLNTTGAYRLFNNTTSADIGLAEMSVGVVSTAGMNAQTDSIVTIRATVANAALTAVGFILRARYGTAAATISALNHTWTIREIQN